MVVEETERMPRVIHAAQTLRLVRRAQLDFLLNWTRDQANASSALPERMLAPWTALGRLDESDKRDWRHLYDGNVLDD
jgi:hypothetical protein